MSFQDCAMKLHIFVPARSVFDFPPNDVTIVQARCRETVLTDNGAEKEGGSGGDSG